MLRLRWAFILPAVWLYPVPAPGADSCVTCHTDPAKLQALIQPPTEIAQEEGEG